MESCHRITLVKTLSCLLPVSVPRSQVGRWLMPACLLRAGTGQGVKCLRAQAGLHLNTSLRKEATERSSPVFLPLPIGDSENPHARTIYTQGTYVLGENKRGRG